MGVNTLRVALDHWQFSHLHLHVKVQKTMRASPPRSCVKGVVALLHFCHKLLYAVCTLHRMVDVEVINSSRVPLSGPVTEPPHLSNFRSSSHLNGGKISPAHAKPT